MIKLLRLIGHWFFKIAEWLEGEEWTSHERYQALHSDKRLMERYGITRTKRFKDAMVKLIQSSPKHKDVISLIRKFNSNKRLYEIKYAGHLFYPVYDRQTHQVVTVLTEKQVHQMMPKDFRAGLGSTLEDIMTWIGRRGFHCFVRFDPERDQNWFTVMINNRRTDTEDPKDGLRYLMEILR